MRPHQTPTGRGAHHPLPGGRGHGVVPLSSSRFSCWRSVVSTQPGLPRARAPRAPRSADGLHPPPTSSDGSRARWLRAGRRPWCSRPSGSSAGSSAPATVRRRWSEGWLGTGWPHGAVMRRDRLDGFADS